MLVFSGVELHGAHGYLLAQFFDRHLNQRQDQWGGSFENRCRMLIRIIRGIREACGKDFLLIVRFSPENYGSSELYPLEESYRLVDILIEEDVDILHASLWNVFKSPEDPEEKSATTLEGLVKHINKRRPLMVAGKVWDGDDVKKAVDLGADFVAVGKVAIANPDWPKHIIDGKNDFKAPPYTAKYLKDQKVGGESFIEYLENGLILLSIDC